MLVSERNEVVREAFASLLAQEWLGSFLLYDIQIQPITLYLPTSNGTLATCCTCTRPNHMCQAVACIQTHPSAKHKCYVTYVRYEGKSAHTQAHVQAQVQATTALDIYMPIDIVYIH